MPVSQRPWWCPHSACFYSFALSCHPSFFSLNRFPLMRGESPPKWPQQFPESMSSHTPCARAVGRPTQGQSQECLPLKRLEGEAQGAWKSPRQIAYQGKLERGPRAHKRHSGTCVFPAEKNDISGRKESRVHVGFYPVGWVSFINHSGSCANICDALFHHNCFLKAQRPPAFTIIFLNFAEWFSSPQFSSVSLP